MKAVSIIISTFGTTAWKELAEEKALPSARAQTLPTQIILSHQKTLHEARNRGAENADGEWLIFLDADDELDPHYVEHMLNALATSKTVGNPPKHLLFEPSVAYVRMGVKNPPRVLPPIELLQGNFLIIGTMVPRNLFFDIGGFNGWPVLEDWDLWIRCWLRGARVYPVPEAIYYAQDREDSRNNSNPELHRQVELQIQDLYTQLAP